MPEEAWHTIALDFITKLLELAEPTSKEKYDSILVINDILTKYAHFILVRETMTAEDMVYILYKHVVAVYGTLEEIRLDRDKLFTSQF